MSYRKTFANVVATTFNTPLVKVNRLVPAGAATVLVKLEFFNPLSSVKDRIGRAMIEAAERDGILTPTTQIIEPTSGNTGIALAFVAAAKGYRLTLTMPESMSLERRALLAMLGRGWCSRRPRWNERSDCQGSGVAASTPNSWVPQQFDNPPTRKSTSKPPGWIWEDTEGRVDALVAKSAPAARSPDGPLYPFQRTRLPRHRVEPPIPGHLRRQSRVAQDPGDPAGFIPKEWIRACSAVWKPWPMGTFAWATSGQEEGILGGISTGANIAAAVRVANRPENRGR